MKLFKRFFKKEKKVKFEIKHRLSGAVLFECEALSLKIAVELAIDKKANLSYADLSSANLSYANLSYANLSYADLSYADLSYANLRSADLSSANLSYANLSYANLSYANLSYADLRSADLRSAKDDFLSKLKKASHEAAELYRRLIDGRIDGSCYEGECSCFCGTIASAKGIDYRLMEKEMGITPDGGSPVEVWFAAIRKGDTPENSSVSAITKDWMEEFMKANEIEIPKRSVSWT